MELPVEQRKAAIDTNHPHLTLDKQCELLGIAKSSYYYQEKGVSPHDKHLMDCIDIIYTENPTYGSRRIVAMLRREHGEHVNRKKVIRLMQVMGIQAVYAQPNLSKSNKEHKKYPYLLKGMIITHPNQVWSTDITYIRLTGGWMYLVAIIDWYSRKIISWKTAITLEKEFCIEALEEAYSTGIPEYFNTDQGSQFTSNEYTSIIEKHGSKVSMDGKGRALDNVYIERFWRSLKEESIYLYDYATAEEGHQGIAKYLEKYNTRRPHQSLCYMTPSEVYNNPHLLD